MPRIHISEEEYWKLAELKAKLRMRSWSDVISFLISNLEKGKSGKASIHSEMEKGKNGNMEKWKEGKAEKRPTKKQLGYLESLIDKVLARGETSQVLVEALDWLKKNADSLTKDEISQVIEDLKEEKYGNVVSLVDGKRYG